MKRLVSLFAAILLLLTLTAPALALDDDEFDGYAADTLTITVGYFGGPYYEKKVFTLDELWAMDVQHLDYTFIDNMPSVVIEHAAGVTLADLMDAAGIDLGSVQSFNFWCNDKTSDYYASLTKTYLIDTPRYCYYSLPDNFDYDEGAGNEYATLDAVRVPTMIALGDDWNRALAGATFGSDFENLNTNTRFRLIFGQTNAVEHTASNSAKWIHRIEVTLGGAPTETADAVPDGTVGSEFNSESYGNTGGAVSELTVSESETPQSGVNLGEAELPQGGLSPTEEVKYHEFSVLPPPKKESENHDGGVQNWRGDEMAENAVALQDIVQDNRMVPVMTVGGLAFLLVGGGIKLITFKRSEDKNVG
ncbi:MAG: hypothetical protein LBN00_06055 [Oscillospiraceae bacterium]|jgi:hypothetical protein|nr:hypothetical protein [Oscillospiraceae bacterium]